MATQYRVPTSSYAMLQWSGYPSPDNWDNIDEYPGLDDYDYNYTSGAEQEDAYYVNPDFSVPAGSTINYVAVHLYGKADYWPGAQQIGAVIGLNNYYEYSQWDSWPSDYYEEKVFYWYNNPYTGSSWTVDEVNGNGDTGLSVFGYIGDDHDGVYKYVATACIEVDYTEGGGGYYEEERQVDVGAEVAGEEYREESEVSASVTVTGDEGEDGLIESRAIVRSVTAEKYQPVVLGRDPAPGETCVKRNKKVGFFIRGQMLDGVDIDTVKVWINGVSYDKNDPEFSYQGYEGEYWIEVDHDEWGYEESISVRIEADSVLGESMTPVEYSFTTEWEDEKTRAGYGRIELFQADRYDIDCLTIDEIWVRQGVVRYSPVYELWWGRYQKLPYIERMKMRVVAGDRVSLGSEVLSKGYLSVRVNDGDFTPLYEDTVVDLGPMFTHSKKDLMFRLLIPEGAETKRYFVLELVFEPAVAFLYSRYLYGTAMYLVGEPLKIVVRKHIYRGYVLDSMMWGSLITGGVLAYPTYRGEDKQW